MTHETLLSDINAMVGIVLSIQWSNRSLRNIPHVDNIRLWAGEWQEQHLNGDRPVFTPAEVQTMHWAEQYLNTLIHRLSWQEKQLTLDIA